MDEFFRLNLHEWNENVLCPSDILHSRRLNGSFWDTHLNFSAQEIIHGFFYSLEFGFRSVSI